MRTRQRHRKSILQKQDRRCFLCMLLRGDDSEKLVELHHVFGGPRRTISEAEGLTVYLCAEHHRTGQDAAHRNADIREMLQAAAQTIWMKDHSMEEWMNMMGKNYLMDKGNEDVKDN